MLNQHIQKISKDYFDYMARRYPVMCLSDEFYFFPRAKKAVGHLHVLDSLDEDKIKDDISYIKGLKLSIEELYSEDLGLEDQIDITMLRQSMSAFLREFEDIKIWQIDPTLYLRIIILGIDMLLWRFYYIREDIDDLLASRVREIPRLLREAERNIKRIPRAYREVALEIIDTLPLGTSALTRRAIQSLKNFKGFLKRRPDHVSFIRDRHLIEGILKDSFSYNRRLEEIYEIALSEYRKTLRRLKKVADSIDFRKSWQEILSSYNIEGVRSQEDLLGLYAQHIEKIKTFLKREEIISIPRTQKIEVKPTSFFMKPIRASASYSSPVTGNKREPAYFYITGDYGNIHNEYIFVTAHETYPGHHLLDAVRRRLKNPIRQQIESPLFYEGWASYAEELIDKEGYIRDPLQRLVGLKRQAWRAVRAMLDVGMRIGKLKPADAGSMLRGLGYSPRIAKTMLRHYILSPGYQLCYTMGKFEIDRLKKRFSSKSGLKRFHDTLLQGGQIPFDLAQKRLKERLCRKNS